MLRGKTVILGVTGGIAAYKSAYLTSLLVKAGADVQVIMTEHAREFISPLTFEGADRTRGAIQTHLTGITEYEHGAHFPGLPRGRGDHRPRPRPT